MKRTLAFAILLFFSLQLLAQQKSNLVFFTENGERFTLILNGLQQNSKPETNVKVKDLPAPSYKIKVIFEDTKLGSLDKTISFKQGTETTFNIRKNNKDEFVLRWLSEVPIEEALSPGSNQSVVEYNSNPNPSGTVTHSQTTTTVSTGQTVPHQDNVNVGVSINDPETGANFNMNVSGGGTVINSSTTQTTTTYTTTTTSSSDYSEDSEPEQTTYYKMPGYNGTIGCPYPLSQKDFISVKQSIASKSFDESKLTIAKQVINTNCLLSSQVKEIMLLFSFEDTRLDLAKYAYGHTYDIGNYYKLNDAFTFESSIEELSNYTANFRR